MPVKMVALKRTPYNHREFRTGEKFEALTHNDALVLQAVGYARPDDEPSSQPQPQSDEQQRSKRQYRRRDMQAEDGEDDKPPRRYKRRDMTAEGDDE